MKLKMKMLVAFEVLVYVSQHVLGAEVYEGDESVLLSCQVNVSVSERSTVVWSREDLKYPMIHVRQNSGDELLDQNQRYRNRTSMRTDALWTGDLSLTLRKPTVSDTDTYTCTVRRFGKVLNQTEVDLLVKERPHLLWPWILVLTVLVLASLGLCAYIFYKRIMKRKAVFETGMVEVTEGEESVRLPFETKANNLTGNIRIKWVRSGTEPVTVHVFESRRNNPLHQDEEYRGRTMMAENPVKTRDLSLTLIKPCFRDRGVYICILYKNGTLLTQKRVALCVKAIQVATVEVMEGVELVLLPFQTTAHLCNDIMVEWNVKDPKPKTVHVYKNGQNQPDKQDEGYNGRTEMNEDLLNTGDLTLTLKNPRVEDGGIYICTIHKDLELLSKKTVALCVKACQVEKVEVTQGVELVLLPFHTKGQLPEDVRVEWRRSDPEPMTVHVYHNRQNQMNSQDSVYQNRTQLKGDLLQTGDLSLTLSKPSFGDSGIYICTVDKDEQVQAQKIVVLCIQENWKETMAELYKKEETNKRPFSLAQLRLTRWSLVESDG